MTFLRDLPQSERVKMMRQNILERLQYQHPNHNPTALANFATANAIDMEAHDLMREAELKRQGKM